MPMWRGACSQRIQKARGGVLDGRIVGQHGDDAVHIAGRFRRGFGERRSILLERFGVRAGAIVYHNPMARVQQIARHGETHVACADECKFHGKCHFKLWISPE
jgi:hypothetical protein